MSIGGNLLMKLMYSRPILRDLSQGSRIAFARQFRGKTQDEISGLLGATGANRRRTMTRYEKGDRNPNITRTKLIADLLGVSYHAIKQYDYKDSLDFIYILLWLEELLPNYHFDVDDMVITDRDFLDNVKMFLKEWDTMRKRRRNREIKYSTYMDWKLTYFQGSKDE